MKSAEARHFRVINPIHECCTYSGVEGKLTILFFLLWNAVMACLSARGEAGDMKENKYRRPLLSLSFAPSPPPPPANLVKATQRGER